MHHRQATTSRKNCCGKLGSKFLENDRSSSKEDRNPPFDIHMQTAVTRLAGHPRGTNEGSLMMVKSSCLLPVAVSHSYRIHMVAGTRNLVDVEILRLWY